MNRQRSRKIKWLVRAVVPLMTLSSVYGGGNDPISHHKLVIVEVPVSDAGEKATEIIASAQTRAISILNSLSVDENYISQIITEAAPDGWTSQQIATRVAAKVTEAITSLEGLAVAKATALVSSTSTSLTKAIKDLAPKAKIQGDCDWCEGATDEAQWSAVAANPSGVPGISAVGSTTVEIDLSGGAGIEVEIKLKITIGMNVGLDVTRFNPVRPTTGTGSSLTVTATPAWKGSVGGTASLQAGLGASLGITLHPGGTLSDVTGILVCPGP